jgi:nitric oxide reductase NorQ protein
MLLTDAQQDAHVNTHANIWVDAWGLLPKIEAAIKSGSNVALRGPTATGKTTLIRQLAQQCGKKLYTFNMTVHTGVEELKGRYIPQPSEDGQRTVLQWVDGQLVVAMREGAWIAIEEANFMPEEISSVLYSVMDYRREIVLDEHDNEVVSAHSEFRVFLTMNWGYRGTTYLNDAIKNRVDAWFDIPYLPQQQEVELLCEKTGIEQQMALQMVKFANQLRSVSDKRISDIGTRILIRWAAMVKSGLAAADAAEHTVVPLLYYDERDKQKVREALAFFFTEAKHTHNLHIGDIVMHRAVSGKKFGIITAFETLNAGEVVRCSWGDTPEQAVERRGDEEYEGVAFVSKVVLHHRKENEPGEELEW